MNQPPVRVCRQCGNDFPAEGVNDYYCQDCHANAAQATPPPPEPMSLTDQSTPHGDLAERINWCLDNLMPRPEPILIRVHVIERNGNESAFLATSIATAGIVTTITTIDGQTHDYILPKHLTVERA